MRSGEQIQSALRALVARWSDFSGSERAEGQTFLNELVDCYGVDRSSAKRLAEDVSHALLFDLPGFRAGDGTLVVSVECLSAPSWAPYDNTTVRRMTAAYQFRTHNLV